MSFDPKTADPLTLPESGGEPTWTGGTVPWRITAIDLDGEEWARGWDQGFDAAHLDRRSTLLRGVVFGFALGLAIGYGVSR